MPRSPWRTCRFGHPAVLRWIAPPTGPQCPAVLQGVGVLAPAAQARWAIALLWIAGLPRHPAGAGGALPLGAVRPPPPAVPLPGVASPAPAPVPLPRAGAVRPLTPAALVPLL